jgi:stage III sporulation protein AC
MDLSFLLKIAGVGIIVAVSCQVLSKLGRDEQATMVSIAGIIVVFLMVIKELAGMIETIKGIFGL